MKKMKAMEESELERQPGALAPSGLVAADRSRRAARQIKSSGN